jgi:hypothetical protein
MIYQFKCQAEQGCEETTQMFGRNMGQLFIPTKAQAQLGKNAFFLFKCEGCGIYCRKEVMPEYLGGAIKSLIEHELEPTDIPTVDAPDLGLQAIDITDPNVELEVISFFRDITPESFQQVA